MQVLIHGSQPPDFAVPVVFSEYVDCQDAAVAHAHVLEKLEDVLEYFRMIPR